MAKYEGVPDGDMTEIADVFISEGFDGAAIVRKLMHHFGGQTLVVPFREYRKWYINKHFNGGNIKELAHEFRIYESTVRVILKSLRKKKPENTVG